MLKRATLLLFLLVLLLSSCSSDATGSSDNTDADIDLSAVVSEINNTFSLPDMIQVNSTEQLYSVYGIAAEDVSAYAAEICSTGIDADEIVLIKASDQDATARIKSQLEIRYESKLSQMKDYLPEQYDIIKACSVEDRGLYVSMIISADSKEMLEIFYGYF